MLLGEFMTAVGHGLRVKVVIYDNSAWGLVHLEMEQIGELDRAGRQLPRPRFRRAGEGERCAGLTVGGPEEIGATVDVSSTPMWRRTSFLSSQMLIGVWPPSAGWLSSRSCSRPNRPRPSPSRDRDTKGGHRARLVEMSSVDAA